MKSKTLNRRQFSALALSSMAPLAATLATPGATQAAPSGHLAAPREKADLPAGVSRFQEIYPGVWKAALGVAEESTPVKLRFRPPAEEALRKLPASAQCPIGQVRGERTKRGFLLKLPLVADEQVYGFGLQFLSFAQRNGKKQVRTNADPRVDSGDTNAPVPFYITTRGYGVLVDSSRYVSFYVGRMSRADAAREKRLHPEAMNPPGPSLPLAQHGFNEPSEMVVEIPLEAGADLYIFDGPTMLRAVERYNLFSGGGCLPPRWGLGFWYRCQSKYNERQVQDLASELRSSRFPCDAIGLEPGWQSHSYSCSFLWSPERCPDPAGMIQKLDRQNYHLNLWEHAFTHSSSPLHKPLERLSGNYEVFEGLVPDFLNPRARKIFGDFQEKEHVRLGVSGYKLDECDNSDFTGGWSFPECSRFPSGVDGEQMHSHFGLAYQHTIEGIFTRRDQRTYHQVRSSNALAAPFPFVLYSDLYDHKQYIRAIVNSGFSGLLWAAEVRDAHNDEDLIRRLQTACLCALAQVNAWYLKNPPWKQVNKEANNAGQFAPNWQKLEARCRDIVNLRMRLVPYLYSAFVRYHERGTPPFRALVMDYPTDRATWKIDDQFLVGDNLMVAPVVAVESKREIYLPEGGWIDFWSGQMFAGGKTITRDVPLDIIPLYVKTGTLLPLAQPGQHAAEPAARQLTVRVFGDGNLPFTLYEDDDHTLAALEGKYNRLVLSWDSSAMQGRAQRIGRGDYPRFEIAGWERPGSIRSM